MAKITVQQISRRAKKIRKPGEKWLTAIRRASKELKGGKKVSATKFIERGETKRTPAKTFRRVRSKKGLFKSTKVISGLLNKKPFTIQLLRKIYPDNMLGYRENVILFHRSAKIRFVQKGVWSVVADIGHFDFTFKYPGYKDFSVVG